MRWIIGGKAAKGKGASPSQMGRFETRWLAQSENLVALTDLSGLGLNVLPNIGPAIASCSIWIRASARRMASKKRAFGTDTSAAPVTIRSISSTSMATWSATYFALETSTAPMAGKASSSPSSRATSVLARPSPFAALQPSRNPACTSTSSRRESSTQSGCRLIRFSKRGLPICSHDRSVAHRTTSCGSTGVSVTERRVGPVRDASLPGWLYHHELDDREQESGRLLQQTWYRGTVDQGRQG